MLSILQYVQCCIILKIYIKHQLLLCTLHIRNIVCKKHVFSTIYIKINTTNSEVKRAVFCSTLTLTPKNHPSRDFSRLVLLFISVYFLEFFCCWCFLRIASTPILSVHHSRKRGKVTAQSVGAWPRSCRHASSSWADRWWPSAISSRSKSSLLSLPLQYTGR